MYLVCECGDKFRDIKTDARDHVALRHAGLVNVEFDALLGAPLQGRITVSPEIKASELYERALDIVTDDMMDALYDDEA